MKLTMLAEISGLRDGKPWPKFGEPLEVPDDEAEVLIGNHLAKKFEKGDADELAAPEVVGSTTEPLPVEVTQEPAPETTKAPTAPVKKAAPAKKAAAKKAAVKG